MGIKNDKGISGVCCTLEDEVQDFEEGTTTGPDLSPMCPYLNSSQHMTWNDALCEMFVENFEGEMGTELPPDTKTTIEKMFLDHLSHLVQPWNESQSFSQLMNPPSAMLTLQGLCLASTWMTMRY